MTGTAFKLLIACILLFSFSSLFAQDHDKDQPSTVNLHIRDYCDPATFGALCSRANTASGAITLAGFRAELAADKSVGAWRFVPDRFEAEEGVNLMLQNLGGETHTFTRVQKFGGGFVAALNAASGNPVPAPECAQTVNGALVPQPPSGNNIFLPAGGTASGPHIGEDEAARFQCCIHPWMRTTINAKEHDGDDDHQEK
jgi:hypothetical protein